jgi:hypothetical protein
MRTAQGTMLLMATGLLVMVSACGDGTSNCNAPISPAVDVGFRMDFNVYRKDGTPFDGVVHFEMGKVYCDGKASGAFTDDGHAVAGYFRPVIVPTFTYHDELDVVDLYFTVIPGSTTPYKLSRSYYYGDVKGKYDWTGLYQETLTATLGF